MAYHSTITSLLAFSVEDKMIAFEALDKVRHSRKAFVRADQLSEGATKSSACKSTKSKPHIILADEPVASLDPITTISVMNDFKRINKKKWELQLLQICIMLISVEVRQELLV